MNILVTGANSEFGNMIVTDLVKAGHRVAGSVRDPEGRNAEAAAALRDHDVEIVDIDVSDDASVRSGVAATSGAFGNVDVLINNAGVGIIGLQESFSDEDFRRVFDINVFGVQRMIRAVLPQMRARRSGLILNISSLLGRVTFPFLGPYNASKWAVEAISENYRTELSQFGVEVAVIEPGGFPTNFLASLLQPSSRDREVEYGDLASAPDAMLEGLGTTLAAIPEQVPQIIADAVVGVVNMASGTRPFRTEVDRGGMGEPIKPYNDQLAHVTEALYTNFGMESMLKLNVGEPKAA
jgi:NAD(P)-dependent dehydrogenase (short-subunit alcohol dehydrogenase family)